MVAERKPNKGLALVTGIALPTNHQDPEPLYLTGNVVSDIFRASGLSDNEIAGALGVRVEDLFRLSSKIAKSEEPVQNFHTELAQKFFSVNIALADRYTTEQIREFWRSGMLEYWEGVKYVYARVYQDRSKVQTEALPQPPKTG